MSRPPFEGSPHAGHGVRKPSPYERLTQAIVTGELVSGQPLVETALAEWCQVSRTPIREALTRLEQDGLVVRSDRGLVVRERTPEEILDIYDTRIVLEAMAARTAAARRSTLDVLTIRRQLDRLTAIDEADGAAMAEGNREFHRAVWRASHNESLTDLLKRQSLHLVRFPSVTLSQPGRWVESIEEHRQMLEAIERQDQQRAHDLAMEHFTRARELRLALWAQDHQD
jgi:DNA-binding GntR family transcriptional regulator